VNLGFRRAKSLKDRNGSLLSSVTDFGFADDLVNFGQPAAVTMLMWERETDLLGVPGLRGMLMIVVMMVFMSSIVVVRVKFAVLRRVFFARKIFFAVDPNVHLGGGDAAADDPRNLQTCAYAQSRHGVLQHSRRNSSVDKRAQKHVAAHAGKTF
jgi:hypothetical protein